jgi:hypothetical protein
MAMLPGSFAGTGSAWADRQNKKLIKVINLLCIEYFLLVL